MKRTLILIMLISSLLMSCLKKDVVDDKYKGGIIIEKKIKPTYILLIYIPNDNKVVKISTYEYYYIKYDIGDTIK
jgi:hypothetical protein